MSGIKNEPLSIATSSSSYKTQQSPEKDQCVINIIHGEKDT